MRQKLSLFITIIFLLGIIAPACGFMWGGKYSLIEICTAKGIETRVVNNDQSPNKPPNHKMADQCQFCFSYTNFSSFLPNTINLSGLYYNLDKQHIYFYEIIYFSRLKNNISARGPPTPV